MKKGDLDPFLHFIKAIGARVDKRLKQMNEDCDIIAKKLL
jgi:hypothetical protein